MNTIRYSAVVLLLVVVGCAPGQAALGTGASPTSAAGPEATRRTKATRATQEGFTSTPLPPTTGTAVVRAKETGRAAAEATMSAAPTETATPAVPQDAPLCRANQLAGEEQAQGATGSIAISLQLTNTGAAVCTLQGPPNIELVDGEGKVLKVDSLHNCLECEQPYQDIVTPAPGTETARVATATAIAHNRLYSKIGVEPHESVGVFIVWSNWCVPALAGPILLRLVLPENLGNVDTATDLKIGGRCDAPGAPSTLDIGPFSH